MKACVLYSGGKDSTYALHWAFHKGFKVQCLLSVKPARSDSWMFHYPAIELVRLQAKIMGFPLVLHPVSGIKEYEVDELKEAVKMAQREYDFDTLVAGALLSDYQRMRVLFVAAELGLKVYTPLWRINQEKYMRSLITQGFKFIITSITVEGLGPEFLGRILTMEDIEEIIRRARKYGFNPAFEGGEAETFVVHAPLFGDYMIEVKGRSTRVGSYEWLYEIREARITTLT